MKKGILPIISIIAILLINYGVYLNINSKYIVTNNVNTLLSNILPTVNKVKNYLEPKGYFDTLKSSKITTQNTLTYNNEELLNITGDIYTSSLKQQGYADLNTIILGKKTVNITSYFNDNKMYFTLKNILKNIYYTDLSSITSKDKEVLTEAEKNRIITYLKDAIITKINNKQLNVENTTLELTKTTKVKKHSISLTQSDIYDIEESFLTKIKNDKEVLKYLTTNYKQININDILKEISDSKKDYNKDNYHDVYIINIYTSGFTNTVVKYEIVNNYGNTSNNTNMTSIYSISKYDNKYKLSNQNTILEINNNIIFEKVSDSIVKITGDIYDFNVDYKYEKNANNISLTGTTSYQKKVVYNLEFNIETIKENNNYQLNLNINIPTDKIKLISKYKINLNTKIPKLDTSSAKVTKDLTEEDNVSLNNLYNEIYNIYLEKYSLTNDNI